MKKLLLISLLMLLLLPNGAQASPKVGVAADMGLSFVVQVDRFNIVLGDNGFAVDYTIKTGPFDDTPSLSWYVAAGGWAGWNYGVGLRVPVGVNWYFAKNWDLYGQVQPVADFDNSFHLDIDGAIGIRYAF